MDRKLFILNIIITLVDTAISALAILAFAWGAATFEMWWLLLFALIPVLLFHAHPLVLERDEPQKEGDKDG